MLVILNGPLGAASRPLIEYRVCATDARTLPRAHQLVERVGYACAGRYRPLWGISLDPVHLTYMMEKLETGRGRQTQ